MCYRLFWAMIPVVCFITVCLCHRRDHAEPFKGFDHGGGATDRIVIKFGVRESVSLLTPG